MKQKARAKRMKNMVEKMGWLATDNIVGFFCIPMQKEPVERSAQQVDSGKDDYI